MRTRRAITYIQSVREAATPFRWPRGHGVWGLLPGNWLELSGRKACLARSKFDLESEEGTKVQM